MHHYHNHIDPMNPKQLRKLAEDVLEKKESLKSENFEALGTEEIKQMFHELRVHQIELEMQNEELMRAEIELMASQERYFNLYELAPAGYMTLSQKGIILQCNLAATTMVGYSRSKLIGLPISRIIYKEDEPIYYSKLKELWLTNNQQSFELRLQKKDGVELWANFTIAESQSDDLEMTTRVIMSDISSRKLMEESLIESEKRYKSLFNYAGVAIAYYQLNGTVISYNQIAANHLGGLPEEFAGRSVYELLSQSEADLCMKRIAETILSDKAMEYEDYFSVSEGDLWLLHTFSKVFDKNGCVTGIQVISKDITELKNKAIELQVAKDHAEVANASKSQFLSNMSHEMRTPMNGILGALQLLEMTDLSEEQKELTQIAHIGSEGLLVLISDILDFSVIEAGVVKFEKMPFGLETLIQETFALFNLSLKSKNIELTKTIEKGIPEILLGDPFRLRQILSNLIGNAIKFTRSGQIEVCVMPFVEQSVNKTTLHFSVKDTGIGIHSDLLSGLFDRFNQGDNSNTRQYGGAGLGLSICKGLIEKSGGAIWVESELGMGSTFHFTFGFETQTDPEMIKKLPHSCKVTTDNKKNPNILLVEDNLDSQNVVRLYALKRNWNLIIVESGYTALKIVKEKAFDVILMDVQIPDLDGIEVTRKIREMALPKYTPIIALTAHALNGDRERCLSVGMDDYLVKPVDLHVLEHAIYQWL